MTVADGSPVPFDPARYIVSTALRVLPGVFSGGPRGPSAAQVKRLEEGGAVRIEQRAGRGRSVTWRLPDGSVVSNERARVIASTPGFFPAPAAPPPQLPTGGEILDDLLKRPRVPARPPPTELERLIKRGPLSDFERLLDRTFRPGGGTIADSRAARVAVPAVLRGVGGLLAGLLYPSTIGYEAPVRPGRRVRARRPPPPPPKVPPAAAVPPPDAPKVPQPLPAPVSPLPDAPRIPTPPDTAVLYRVPPFPQPTQLPSPRPVALPASPISPFPFLLPLALLIPSPSVGNRPGRLIDPNYRNPNIDLTGPVAVAPRPLTAPLTLAQTAPLGSGPGDPCKCTGTRSRKPKKKRCSNPIVSKRTRTESNRKFLTITREIKCQ